jgi:hypothetical protein
MPELAPILVAKPLNIKPRKIFSGAPMNGYSKN